MKVRQSTISKIIIVYVKYIVVKTWIWESRWTTLWVETKETIPLQIIGEFEILIKAQPVKL